MSSGSIEQEIKFGGVELEQLRERLAELEAERVGAGSFEDNLILDKDGELEGKKCILRLRTDGHGATVTYKGPARFEGRLKIREEHETKIANAGEAKALFKALGYEPVRRYQKVREEWHLGGVTIALDHTPIGDFAEFEGEGAETVARRCGLDLDKSERRNYLRLYEDYLKEHPEAPANMVFKEDEAAASNGGRASG